MKNGTFDLKLKFEGTRIVDQKVDGIKKLRNIFEDLERKFE